MRNFNRRHLLVLAAGAVGACHPALAADAPARQTFTYKTVDGLEIKADVYRAPGEAPQPAILWLHGGSLIMASRTLLPPRPMRDRYLALGFTLVSIDYRLAPETKLPQIVADMEDAYAWLRAEGPRLFNIDAESIAVAGMSAGAYLAQLAGARLKPHPKAVVSFYGYGDITGPWLAEPNPAFNGTPPIPEAQARTAVLGAPIAGPPQSEDAQRGIFNIWCRQNGRWTNEISGHAPVREKDWFVPYEARPNITSAYPPIILLHGQSDADVPFAQSVVTAKALAFSGVAHEFVTNPRWGHAFDYGKPDAAITQAFDRVATFLGKHLAA